MNFYGCVYWDVERSVDAKFGRGVDDDIDSDIGADVGSGDGKELKLLILDGVGS